MKNKHDRYKTYWPKLRRAIDNGYSIEALSLEYALFEERLSSVLHYLALKKVSNFQEKILILKNESNSDVFQKFLTGFDFEALHRWKNKRNDIIHNLLKMNIGYDEIERSAIEGYAL